MDIEQLRHTLYESVNNLVDAIENAERIAADAHRELLQLKKEHESEHLMAKAHESMMAKLQREAAGL